MRDIELFLGGLLLIQQCVPSFAQSGSGCVPPGDEKKQCEPNFSRCIKRIDDRDCNQSFFGIKIPDPACAAARDRSNSSAEAEFLQCQERALAENRACVAEVELDRTVRSKAYAACLARHQEESAGINALRSEFDSAELSLMPQAKPMQTGEMPSGFALAAQRFDLATSDMRIFQVDGTSSKGMVGSKIPRVGNIYIIRSDVFVPGGKARVSFFETTVAVSWVWMFKSLGEDEFFKQAAQNLDELDRRVRSRALRVCEEISC
jgi:hypothetical protein